MAPHRLAAALVLALVVSGAAVVPGTGATPACDEDASPPIAFLRGPQGRVLDLAPEVVATVRDPCGVDPDSIRLSVGGIALDVNARARDENGTEWRVTAQLEEELAAGPHDVLLRARDVAGNEVKSRWEFLLLPNSLPGERKYAHAAVAAGVTQPATLPLVDGQMYLAGALVAPASRATNLTLTAARLTALPPEVTAPPADPLLVLDVDARATQNGVAGPARLDHAVLRIAVPLDVLDDVPATAAQVQLLHFRDGAWQPLPRGPAETNATHAVFNATTPRFSPFALVADSQPPSVQGLAPANGAFLSAVPQVRAGVRDNVAVSLAQIVVNGNIAATLRQDVDGVVTHGPDNLFLEDGRHTVDVSAEDASGNAAAARWTFILDRTPPTFPRVVVTPPETTPDPVLVDVAYLDTLSGADASTVRVTLDGADVTSSSNVTRDGVTLALTRLTAGEHELHVTLKDRAGNAGDLTHAFTVPAKTPAPGAALALVAVAVALALAARRRA